MNSHQIKFSFDLNGIPFVVEIGNLGFQSHVALLATYGETTVFITLNVGDINEDVDFLPLTVEYVEKLYAGGIISSSPYIKREGKPTENEILNARIIDHSIRSLFKNNFKHETQIIVQVFSYDEEHDPVIAALIGVSFCLAYSGIPFSGPFGSTKVGFINNKLVINPKLTELLNSQMELFVSSVTDGIVSIEGEIKNLNDDIVKEAVKLAFTYNQNLIQIQKDFINKFGTKEFVYFLNEEKQIKLQELVDNIYELKSIEIKQALYQIDKKQRKTNLEGILNELSTIWVEKINNNELTQKDIEIAFEKVCKKIFRENLLKYKQRPDHRKIDEIRPIDVKVGVLPRVHGSALFTRGETQSLTIVTLGTDREELLLQSLDGDLSKRYFHHYNMPGYANGEIDRKFGLPNRRSIGHGAIGEKSIKNLLPDEKIFPYTIRVVSEILSSNGSTSMAATCASSLALMDAGVPIKEAVAGIGVGLVYEGMENYEILVDIIGIEDFYGDMDFKVTGTQNGITAIQLDNKIAGIPLDIIFEAFDKSRLARLFVLEKMNNCISTSRPNISPFAPIVKIIEIDPSKIGAIIGTGGKVIKSIMEKTQTKISIEDNGSVKIYSNKADLIDDAIVMIYSVIGNEIPVDVDLYAEITRIEDYGVFVQVPNTQLQGLVHISNLGITKSKFDNIRNFVKIGQKIKVRFLGKDEKGRNKFKAISL